MLIPSEKAFALSKVKTLKDGGLDVHYEVTETIGNESYTNKYHVESAKDIHRICGIVSTVCAQSWDGFLILRPFFQWLKRPISKQPKSKASYHGILPTKC